MAKKKEKLVEQQPVEVLDTVETPEEEVLPEEQEEAKEEVKEEEKTEKEEPRTRGRDRGGRRRWEKEKKEWIPVTKLGKLVKEGKITDIDEIFNKGLRIMEDGIVDKLLPSLEHDLIAIGQSKGKFGGGKRRAWRQTQKKTAEENVPSFSCMVVVGDGKGHIGIGYGKAKETLPAREKAMRKAKLNIIKVQRGCGSFDCGCSEPHSIPFAIGAKCGSVEIKLIPAPKGTGLAIEDECKKILKLAGISDIYSRTEGKTKTKFNLATACLRALEKTIKVIR